jgi:beta-N-acetylhexosaminidase
MGMMAHVVYTAWDPDHPASQSPIVIRDIVRERIGFAGFLMSDDSNMNALTGSQAERAAACVAAGCDVALPCNGVLSDNVEIAKALGEITIEGADRLARAMAGTRIEIDNIDFAEEIAKRDLLLAQA